MRPNRGIDPTRVNQCPICARDCLPTPLGVAEHRARHIEEVRRNRQAKLRQSEEHQEMCNLRDAWRGYASELESLCSDLRGQIAIRDECIEGLEADFRFIVDELQRLCTELEAAS